MTLKIFHRDRTHAERRLGVSHGYHLTWQKRPLPGSGAMQYSWETYGLPPYPRFGNGNINVQNPSLVSQPASYTLQAVGIVGIPPAGQLQGQFTTQPLMDPTSAEMAGIVIPGAVPNTITNNQIINGAKATLNP